MSNERIDLTQFEGLMESIVICKEEYIKGQDSLLEDCQTLKDRMQIILAELKRCYEEIDALHSITQDWVKIETFTDDGKDLFVDMEDSDGNCFSGYINRASK